MQKDVRSQIARCLRLLADLVETLPAREVMNRVEAALSIAIAAPLGEARDHSRRPPRGDSGSAVAPQVSADERDRQRARLVDEFGRDIMSDAEFPTRQKLADFARENGVALTDRDTKASIRQKLLSKAELRNMDAIIRGTMKPSGQPK